MVACSRLRALCKHDFEQLKDQPNAGDITIAAGEQLTLRYRIFFHQGDAQSARVAEHYESYAQGN